MKKIFYKIAAFFLVTTMSLSCSKDVRQDISFTSTYNRVILNNLKIISDSYGIHLNNIYPEAFQGSSYSDINSLFLSIKMHKLLINDFTPASEFVLLSNKMQNDISNHKLIEYGLFRTFITYVNTNPVNIINSNNIKDELVKKAPIQVSNCNSGNSGTLSTFLQNTTLPDVVVTGYIPANNGIDYGTWNAILNMLSSNNGSYIPTSISSGSGGGGGGSAASAPSGISFVLSGQLSCSSFSFSPIASNWQEAGVSGLQFVADWGGAFAGFIVKGYGNVYVGMPIRTASGRTITKGYAATVSAQAANQAAQIQIAKYYGMDFQTFATISPVTLANEFRSLMQGFLSNIVGAGCTVSRYQAGANTITQSANWSGGGPCY